MLTKLIVCRTIIFTMYYLKYYIQFTSVYLNFVIIRFDNLFIQIVFIIYDISIFYIVCKFTICKINVIVLFSTIETTNRTTYVIIVIFSFYNHIHFFYSFVEWNGQSWNAAWRGGHFVGGRLNRRTFLSETHICFKTLKYREQFQKTFWSNIFL